MASNPGADLPILIVGAGVAGLALAQGLRLHSIPFRVFERYPRSHALQGHRFRISNEGQAALDGVLSPQLQLLLKDTAVDRQLFEPRYVDPKKLDFAKPTPVTPKSTPMDRTLLRMLTTLDIEEHVEYEKDFESFEIINEQVHARFVDGSIARGQLLVGADGVRSRVRKQLQPNRKLLDLERWILWGRTSLTEDLKRNLSQDVLSWCMYLDREANVQAVVEPMRWSTSVRHESNMRLPDFPDYVYWCICTASSQYRATLPKTVDERRLCLEAAIENWHPSLKLLFDSATHDLSACVPILSSKPDIELLSAVHTGQVTLIGDAAHPMSPMGGSGADTAIRGAADLAGVISKEGIPKGGMEHFETRLEELAKTKIEHSFAGGRKFWLGKEWAEYSEVDT
ncbi:FAD/NAD(P)-binding domain-containing protein [Hypoxylon sp. FL1284]|nr:FAD/NAD(P)-binding domain-containing protein [Hypoxylon sp. FL1284]